MTRQPHLYNDPHGMGPLSERSPRGLDLNPFEGKNCDLCDMQETSAMKVPTKRDTKTRDFSHIPLPVGTFEDERLLFPRQVGCVSSLQNTLASFQECLLRWFLFLQFVVGEGVSWFDTKRYSWVAGFLDTSDLGTFVKQTSPVWDGTNMWKVDEWLFCKMDAAAGKNPNSVNIWRFYCHQMHIHQKMKMIGNIFHLYHFTMQPNAQSKMSTITNASVSTNQLACVFPGSLFGNLLHHGWRRWGNHRRSSQGGHGGEQSCRGGCWSWWRGGWRGQPKPCRQSIGLAGRREVKDDSFGTTGKIFALEGGGQWFLQKRGAFQGCRLLLPLHHFCSRPYEKSTALPRVEAYASRDDQSQGALRIRLHPTWRWCSWSMAAAWARRIPKDVRFWKKA